MTERLKRKILDLYLCGEIDAALEEVVKGWLSENINNPDTDAALYDFFDETLISRTPKTSTYRNFQALQWQLGFNKNETVRIPLGRRHAFKVAAVLIPTLIIIGAAFSFLKTDIEQIKEISAAEIVADTVPDILPEEIIPMATVEIAEIPEPKAPVGKPEPQPVEKPTPIEKPKPAVYDFEVTSGDHMHKYVVLADNSTVVLNGRGTVKFCSEKREALLSGEAYFNVAKGQRLPFKVVTEHLTVSVTGTEFNVTALAGNQETSVDLVHGSVNIDSKAGNIELKPQEQFTLDNQSGLTKIGKTKNDCWWNEPLIFEGLTIYEILCGLENCYGTIIHGKEKTDNTVLYSIKFSKMSSLDYVLDILHEIYPEAEYKKDGGTVTVDMIDTEI